MLVLAALYVFAILALTTPLYLDTHTIPLLINNMAWNNSGTLQNNINFGSCGTPPGAFNSWTLPVTVSDADFAPLDDPCTRGPRQADGSLPNCPFLHLAPGSDLIDKGTNIGTPFTGSAPDLGAFEN